MSGFKCPYCDADMEHHDSFGRFCAHQDGKHLGEIYKCSNEDCAQYCHAYADRPDELREGYPC